VRTNLVFVFPVGSDAVSGGNIYNAEIVRALRETVAVKTISIEEYKRSVARLEPIVHEAQSLYFIDTLNLSDFLALPAGIRGQRFALIVHHLPSLEPGIDLSDDALRVEAAAFCLFDRFLATSPFTAKYLVSRGIPRDKIMTVIPGLRPVEYAVRGYEPPLRAVMVGNLIPRKAILEFLRALDRLSTEDDSFVIDVVGRTDMDPAYVKACRDLVSTSQHLRRRVHLHGPVPYEQIDRHYGRSSALVSAAKMETYGMALAEARAHGLPIFALDRGHVRNHFTHGENGLLFSSLEDLAEGFLSLARDNRAMAELFARARKQLATGDCTWRAAAARFLEQLEY
jgi:glycosyltransferase involved in cell wall biosynthesis